MGYSEFKIEGIFKSLVYVCGERQAFFFLSEKGTENSNGTLRMLILLIVTEVVLKELAGTAPDGDRGQQRSVRGRSAERVVLRPCPC